MIKLLKILFKTFIIPVPLNKQIENFKRGYQEKNSCAYKELKEINLFHEYSKFMGFDFKINDFKKIMAENDSLNLKVFYTIKVYMMLVPFLILFIAAVDYNNHSYNIFPILSLTFAFFSVKKSLYMIKLDTFVREFEKYIKNNKISDQEIISLSEKFSLLRENKTPKEETIETEIPSVIIETQKRKRL